MGGEAHAHERTPLLGRPRHACALDVVERRTQERLHIPFRVLRRRRENVDPRLERARLHAADRHERKQLTQGYDDAADARIAGATGLAKQQQHVRGRVLHRECQRVGLPRGSAHRCLHDRLLEGSRSPRLVGDACDSYEPIRTIELRHAGRRDHRHAHLRHWR